jgi:hypothetical protein
MTMITRMTAKVMAMKRSAMETKMMKKEKMKYLSQFHPPLPQQQRLRSERQRKRKRQQRNRRPLRTDPFLMWIERNKNGLGRGIDISKEGASRRSFRDNVKADCD